MVGVYSPTLSPWLGLTSYGPRSNLLASSCPKRRNVFMCFSSTSLLTYSQYLKKHIKPRRQRYPKGTLRVPRSQKLFSDWLPSTGHVSLVVHRSIPGHAQWQIRQLQVSPPGGGGVRRAGRSDPRLNQSEDSDR